MDTFQTVVTCYSSSLSFHRIVFVHFGSSVSCVLDTVFLNQPLLNHLLFHINSPESLRGTFQVSSCSNENTICQQSTRLSDTLENSIKSIKRMENQLPFVLALVAYASVNMRAINSDIQYIIPSVSQAITQESLFSFIACSKQ